MAEKVAKVPPKHKKIKGMTREDLVNMDKSVIIDIFSSDVT